MFIVVKVRPSVSINYIKKKTTFKCNLTALKYLHCISEFVVYRVILGIRSTLQYIVPKVGKL